MSYVFKYLMGTGNRNPLEDAQHFRTSNIAGWLIDIINSGNKTDKSKHYGVQFLDYAMKLIASFDKGHNFELSQEFLQMYVRFVSERDQTNYFAFGDAVGELSLEANGYRIEDVMDKIYRNNEECFEDCYLVQSNNVYANKPFNLAEINDHNISENLESATIMMNTLHKNGDHCFDGYNQIVNFVNEIESLLSQQSKLEM